MLPSDLYSEQFRGLLNELHQKEHSNWQDLHHYIFVPQWIPTKVIKEAPEKNLPIETASLPQIFRPVNISSFATDLPTNLGSRWVPPALQNNFAGNLFLLEVCRNDEVFHIIWIAISYYTVGYDTTILHMPQGARRQNEKPKKNKNKQKSTSPYQQDWGRSKPLIITTLRKIQIWYIPRYDGKPRFWHTQHSIFS